MEDPMRFFNVCRRLCRWQADSPFDAIKHEANHLFVTGEVAIAQVAFLLGDGFLSIHMPGHFRLREEGVDAMDGCATDLWDVAVIP
jgi:hypothetical protein